MIAEAVVSPGHDGEAVLVVRVAHENVAIDSVTLDATCAQKLMENCEAQSAEELKGQPWRRLMAVHGSSNRGGSPQKSLNQKNRHALRANRRGVVMLGNSLMPTGISPTMNRTEASSLRSLFRLVMATAATLALATSASAQESPSETIGPIAKEVTATIDRALRFAEAADRQEVALHQRSRNAALAMMKDVRAMSAAYEKRVKQSRPIGDTEFFFDSLQAGVESVRKTARDAVPDPRVAKQLDHLNELFDQLAALYVAAR